ncbi:zinc-finger homeodomain protein 10-like [Olea europaea var. sylvestris]|uniref:Zinc-finger homeodomain 10-like n=1 Tax=Olea europaea subsp. europaea TaxID=158383 RepID=A0A8S0PJJ7_OLEEU|nr:zinc-finger homeodomain protein 10-like [Olea europaea var. sylvestris]CAA2953372.1 zinc-finger homeodomain 10-like [Olea europaea subsp. europaea]
MDLYPSPTRTKSPDESEYDTPPYTEPNEPFLSFTNGAIKKIHHNSPPPAVVVTYKDCLKNHAASFGGHAVDGCGEFMPSPSTNTADPTTLKCAACGCHRNFHRREPNDPSPTSIIPPLFYFRHPPPPRRPTPSPSPPPQPNMLLALSMAVPEDHHQAPVTPTEFKTDNLSGRKRFRTKFSQEQKEKMHSFSKKLGWKMQKCEESKVEEFCKEIGVSRGVLKVWMHNNKNISAKTRD